NSGFSGAFSNAVGALTFTIRTAASNNAQWSFTGGTVTLNNFIGSVNFGSLSGSSSMVSTSAGGTSQQGARINVGNLNLDSTYSGSITGAAGLAKSGSGTFTLTGQNGFFTDAITSLLNIPVVISRGTIAAGAN